MLFSTVLSESVVARTVVLSLLSVFVYAVVSKFATRRGRLPPGPPAKPIIGNILTLPRSGAWLLLTKYKDTFGDLVFLHGLGNQVLVLNSMKAINDLVDKRANVYSHRPVFTVVGELMGLGQSMPLLPYGKEWREHRKLAHVALSPAAVKKYHGVQEDIAALMNRDFLDRPEDFFSHVRLTMGRLILSVTYGLSVDTADSQYITHAEETMHIIEDGVVPGAFLCDFIPMMKWLPSWVPFQREQPGKGYDRASSNRELGGILSYPGSAEDDTYEGYFIPKGTIVIPNSWAISLEPNDKYDPKSFIPERFLDQTQSTIDPASYAFGYGRRICPGKAMAENSVFVLITGILAAFDISPPEGGLTPRFGPSLVSYPEPFECRIRPRSEAKAALVRRRAAQCKLIRCSVSC
ncbi:O-methylsterigmatocystin oxidoreductase [Grifola frondosa]|uniref:O-methylsterigmatocystin oxidoreductase n=1 Tax=Grifola frondosa TaxID=5627 RepID=A0A1C7MBP8_GRIFR|nr:O-methylsterigmatocystin oxidoreductase [Grifola frondosa]